MGDDRLPRRRGSLTLSFMLNAATAGSLCEYPAATLNREQRETREIDEIFYTVQNDR